MSDNGNGNGGRARQVADNVLLLLAARSMAVVGPLVGGWLFMQVWDDLKDIKRNMQALATFDAVVSVRIENLHERVKTLEDRPR
ncbi:MAG: hypothetical protein HY246_18355 [Proteobacteria bacterium]|nr:hypothetical protein [Pseudomonadota bacterium]